MHWDELIGEILMQLNSNTEKCIKKILENLLIILSKERQFSSIGIVIKNNVTECEAICIEDGKINYELPKGGLKTLLLDYILSEESFCLKQNKIPIFKIDTLSNLFILPINFNNKNYGFIWFEKDKEACGFFEDEIASIYKITFTIAWLFYTITKDYPSKYNYSATKKEEVSNFDELVFKSQIMQNLLQKVSYLAKYDLPILITGETGTGKDEIAKIIHKLSKYNRGSFVTVNCGAIPETLFESELFGHKKGAFTTAVSDKAGLIKEANGGTIFFDEIGDLSLANQVKLLRVIENKEFRAIGENKLEKANARFTFATNKDLDKMIKRGTFREDLYFRISAAHIHLPPLRDRIEDIPVLFDKFLYKFSKELGITKPMIKESLYEFIKTYPWYGNIRELANITKEILLWHNNSDYVDISDLPERYINYSKDNIIHFNTSLREAKNKFTKDYVMKIMQQCQYNKTKASKALRISKWGLIKLLRRLEIA